MMTVSFNESFERKIINTYMYCIKHFCENYFWNFCKFSRGFINSRLPGKLTGCEDCFAQLL